MKVDEWFPRWFAMHAQIYSSVSPPWPAADTEEFSALSRSWRKAFYPINATSAEASEASDALVVEEKMRFRSDHPRLIVEWIISTRAALAAATGSAMPSGFEDARRRSLDCRLCEGRGVASIDLVGLDPPIVIRLSSGREVEPTTVALACECPAGRFLAHGDPDAWSRADLTKHPRIAAHARSRRAADDRLSAEWDARARRPGEMVAALAARFEAENPPASRGVAPPPPIPKQIIPRTLPDFIDGAEIGRPELGVCEVVTDPETGVRGLRPVSA